MRLLPSPIRQLLNNKLNSVHQINAHLMLLLRPAPLSVYMCFRSTFHWMVWLVFVLVLLLFPSNRTQQKLYPAEEMRACSMWCHSVSGAFAPQNGPLKCDNASHQASKLSLLQRVVLICSPSHDFVLRVCRHAKNRSIARFHPVILEFRVR